MDGAPMGICPVHFKKLTHVCITEQCSCQIRLCQSCVQSHTHKIKNSSIMKQQTFNNKINIEVDILLKQYSFMNQELNQLVQGKTQVEKLNEIKVVQNLMKAFIEDKKAINNLLDSFDDNHKNIFAKLKALNTGSWEAYFHHLSINKMIPLTLRVLSPTGMQAFGKRVAIYTSSLGKFEDFLKNTKRFGTTLQEFLKESCQDTLYQTLTNLLTKKYADWMNQPLQTQQQRSRSPRKTENIVVRNEQVKRTEANQPNEGRCGSAQVLPLKLQRKPSDLASEKATPRKRIRSIFGNH